MLKKYCLFLICVCSFGCQPGLKSSGGENYNKKENLVEQNLIIPKFTAVYNEATHSILMTARFELKDSSVRGTSQMEDVELENASNVKIDNKKMEFQTDESYLGDDSRSDVVGCSYRYKIEGITDLNKTFIFSWVARDGHSYSNIVKIPGPIYLTTSPSTISLNATAFSVSYGPVPVPASEGIYVAINSLDNPLATDLEFNSGSTDLSIPMSTYGIGPSSISLIVVHRSENQATDMPKSGGSIYGEYGSSPVVVKIVN